MKLKLLLSAVFLFNSLQASEKIFEIEDQKWRVRTDVGGDSNPHFNHTIITHCHYGLPSVSTLELSLDPPIFEIDVSRSTPFKPRPQSGSWTRLKNFYNSEAIYRINITVNYESREACNLRSTLEELTNESDKDLLYSLRVVADPENPNKAEETLSNFIAVLYNKGFISDYVTTILQKDLYLPDFRFDKDTFMANLNKQLSDDASPEYLEDILNNQFEELKTFKQKQIAIAMAAVKLHENQQNHLTIEKLCQKVTDPSISQFPEVKRIQANLLFTNKNDLSFLEKNRDAISILSAIPDKKTRDELTRHYKLNLLNGDVSPAQQKLDLSPELEKIDDPNAWMYMGIQAEEIRKLKSELN